MKDKPRLLRITTVPMSLKFLLKGQLGFMQSNGLEVLALSADGPEIKAVTDEGVKHQVVNLTRKITPFADLWCIFQIMRVIRKFKPHIVHTHTPKAGLIGMIAAWICRVPVRMHTVAGLPLMEARGLKRMILSVTEKITYTCATNVYPNSTALASYIEQHLYPSTSKFKVIGKGSSNGIDTSFFSITNEVRSAAQRLRETSLLKDELTFSFVGRIVKDKGINELLKAFDRLSKEVACRLILVGPFEDDLDPISDESRAILKANKHIITTGYVNDVRPPLVASDVFVFPSYREGFPNVVMQACCLERPCIVTNINGCNEIIQHGKTGLIVEPKNEHQLYEAMKDLAVNPSRREEFGALSRKFVAANFDQLYLWNLILAEYKTLLELVHQRR
jgi:glycosyltransferase involved in cell wall biosynthesis